MVIFLFKIFQLFIIEMPPIKKNFQKIDNKIKSKKNTTLVNNKKRNKEYGTSKLEEKFAQNFLVRLGVNYVYQYKMGSIGRYLDFYLPEYRIGIEVDGDYYHSYGLVYEEMNPMQKRNHRVDNEKNKWCSRNGIFLVRIWEHDINKHSEKVYDYLKQLLDKRKEKTKRFG